MDIAPVKLHHRLGMVLLTQLYPFMAQPINAGTNLFHTHQDRDGQMFPSGAVRDTPPDNLIRISVSKNPGEILVVAG